MLRTFFTNPSFLFPWYFYTLVVDSVYDTGYSRQPGQAIASKRWKIEKLSFGKIRRFRAMHRVVRGTWQISRIICGTTETYKASLSQNQRTSRVRLATNSQQIMALFVILSGGNYISFTDRLPLGLSRSLLLIRKLAPPSLPSGYRYRIRNNNTAMTNCHCAVHANCRSEPKS